MTQAFPRRSHRLKLTLGIVWLRGGANGRLNERRRVFFGVEKSSPSPGYLAVGEEESGDNYAANCNINSGRGRGNAGIRSHPRVSQQRAPLDLRTGCTGGRGGSEQAVWSLIIRILGFVNHAALRSTSCRVAAGAPHLPVMESFVFFFSFSSLCN